MGSLSSDTRPIAVVAAMSEELAPLRSRLTARESARAGGLGVDRGWLNGRRVLLAATGDGAGKARAGIAELLASGPLDGLIVIGVAGALSAGLGSGTLVVASRVIDEGGRTFDADAQRVAAAARATGGRPGVVVSAGRIADSPSEKLRLSGLAGAQGAAVVDLESATYLAAATAAGVPWLVLRSVSDTADEALPELLNRSRDAGGAVRRRQVLMGLLRQPQSLPFLLTLRGRVARGAEALAVAATAVLSVFEGAGVSAVPAPAIAREAVS